MDKQYEFQQIFNLVTCVPQGIMPATTGLPLHLAQQVNYVRYNQKRVASQIQNVGTD